mmetsp:Transcript_19662/g.50976  ORF Transcript_19662/g.50976 Transcript_19662/m.50976 type:complete len:214 (+) Transcript_19662:2662-3303(+)
MPATNSEAPSDIAVAVAATDTAPASLPASATDCLCAANAAAASTTEGPSSDAAPRSATKACVVSWRTSSGVWGAAINLNTAANRAGKPACSCPKEIVAPLNIRPMLSHQAWKQRAAASKTCGPPAASALVTTCCTNASTPRRWFAIAWLAALARAESRLLDSVLTSVSMTSAYRSWSGFRAEAARAKADAQNWSTRAAPSLAEMHAMTRMMRC